MPTVNTKPTMYLIQSIGGGSLSIMAKPAPDDLLENEIDIIASAGINKIVSLLEFDESAKLGLKNEQAKTEKYGMEFFSYPIADRGLPATVDEFSQFTKQLYNEISGGLKTLIHCHGGIGRSGIVASAILLHCGFTAENAFQHVSQKRQISVPDTQEQIDWIVSHAAEIVG